MSVGGVDVVCLNCGSSSVKGARYRVHDESGASGGSAGEERIAEHEVEEVHGDEIGRAAVSVFVELRGDDAPAAVGHRMVHGGPALRAPVVIDADVRTQLDAAVAFAPLHLPPALAAVDAVSAEAPGVPQVACFDTAFHATLPEVAWRLPVARELANRGIRRYGFHGLSYEYIVGAVGADVLGRAVVAHLGNGASLCAIRDGRSVATSMGLTPTGGIPMGTRSGDLDPGVIVHLVREEGYDAARLEALVDGQSGLLGLGGASDMRELLDRRAKADADATLAVEVFCTRVAMEIGAYATVLGGLDTIVFTAGIGERGTAIRAEVGARLAHLGVDIDAAQNAQHASVISTKSSSVIVRVVPTDEDAVIARHTAALLQRT